MQVTKDSRLAKGMF